MKFLIFLKRLVRQFPKLVFVVTVLAVSTGLFALWWFKRSVVGGRSSVADISRQVALIESKPERLLLVENDLYDVDSGTVIFPNWLKNGMPRRLFYDKTAKKFIAQYETGFIRYAATGEEDARLLMLSKPAFADDYKWMVFAKEREVWRADIDWLLFKIINEKKLTAIDQFFAGSFADNIQFGTEKTLIVRNVGKVLRVNLETGDVKPMRFVVEGLKKRHSPDSKFVVGVEGGQFYCYDVDADAAKTIDIGKGVVNNFQWLGNDRCIALAASKTVILYDRLQHTLTELIKLPSPNSRMGELSPGGRFIFTIGRGGALLLDLEQKTASVVTGGAGVRWVSADTFAFSREIPDSDLRGTWLQTVGHRERRVSPTPYLVVGNEAKMLKLPEAGFLIYSAKSGLFKMRLDGTDVSEVVKLPRAANAVMGIRPWDPGTLNEGELPGGEISDSPGP
jgi:hypothetical protein